MKKKYFLSFLVILIFSCSSYKVNFLLSRLGVFEDEVKLRVFVNTERKVVLVPMHHIGTELFYEDVKQKIDSLQKRDYKVYYEMISVDTIKQDNAQIILNYRKLRKLLGKAITGSENKLSIIEKLSNNKKVKLKKELINQPSYKELGLNMNGAKNVDLKLDEIIAYYENKFGKIQLEDCDFANLPIEEYFCKNSNKDKDIYNEIIIELRNKKVINELEKDKTEDIAVIYGKGHFDEIEKYLLNNNYKVP
jgi:hypothetical protein